MSENNSQPNNRNVWLHPGTLIALATFLIVQSATGLIWLTTLGNQVATNAKSLEKLQSDQKQVDLAMRTLAVINERQQAGSLVLDNLTKRLEIVADTVAKFRDETLLRLGPSPAPRR